MASKLSSASLYKMDIKKPVSLLVLCIVASHVVAQGGNPNRGPGDNVPPEQGLRMPDTDLITWDEFKAKVAGTKWVQIYLLMHQFIMPKSLQRFTTSPVMTGDHTVFMPFKIRAFGECRTHEDFDFATEFVHAEGEPSAITRSGLFEDRYFGDPDSYIFIIRCVDYSTVVDGVCTGAGLLTMLVKDFPPNNLNTLRVTQNLRTTMGIDFLDPRMRFDAGAEECP